MPERVVDLLEPVDVQEERGDRTARRGQVGVDELVQVGAVGQAGERVVPRLPGRGPFGAHPGGHVGVGQHDVARLVDPRGLHVEPPGARREPHREVGGGAVAQAHGELADAGQQRAAVLVVAHPEGEGEVVAADGDAEAVVVEVLGGLGPGGVRQQDPPVRVDQQRRRGQRVEDGLHQQRCAGAVAAAVPHVGGQGPAGPSSHCFPPPSSWTPVTSSASPSAHALGGTPPDGMARPKG
ncbi:hypothetical protein [Blastococcus sp. TML/C7B]|uniref:hypothetical protein n=1 Tax=Blastococcus sp. TML/C7B TaxID=2798728 RepID=UPI0028153603|nr:hypothetical protein [Blastococcus sp. TML/C7B]